MTRPQARRRSEPSLDPTPGSVHASL
jgi:hypothetical protein